MAERLLAWYPLASMVWFFKKKSAKDGEKSGAGFKEITSSPSIPREPRVRVVPLRGIGAEIDQLALSNAQLGNLSASGAGFIAEHLVKWPEMGSKIVGRFVLQGDRIPFEGDLVHQTGQIIGVRF